MGEKVEEEMTGVFEEAAGGTFDDAIEDDEEEQMEQLAQASSVMSPIEYIANTATFASIITDY